MTVGYAERSNAVLSVEVAEKVGIAAQDIRGIWDRYVSYRATCAELNALTDRQLNDLGMDRKSVKAVARRAVYGA